MLIDVSTHPSWSTTNHSLKSSEKRRDERRLQSANGKSRRQVQGFTPSLLNLLPIVTGVYAGEVIRNGNEWMSEGAGE